MILHRNVRFGAVAAFIIVTLVGCDPFRSSVALTTETNATTEEHQPPGTAIASIAEPPSETDIQPTTVQPEQPTNAPQSPPPDDSEKKVETSSDNKPATPKNEPKTVAEYNVKKPSLAGILLTDTKPNVWMKAGEPLGEYSMEDGQDPLTVHEYIGFSVGFNVNDTVQFVEITTRDVNTGLNGLRLGDTVKDAEKSLGPPDSNTGFAMQYKAGGTILKLDIDPERDVILSIKLFADS